MESPLSCATSFFWYSDTAHFSFLVKRNVFLCVREYYENMTSCTGPRTGNSLVPQNTKHVTYYNWTGSRKHTFAIFNLVVSPLSTHLSLRWRHFKCQICDVIFRLKITKWDLVTRIFAFSMSDYFRKLLLQTYQEIFLTFFLRRT